MSFRESLFEELAGDLEYHPKRAALYLFLATAAISSWMLCSPETKFTATPLVLALGSLTLFLKGVFLLRKSSEGLALTSAEFDNLSDPTKQKDLPQISMRAAQILQDFGAGPLLLWPILNMGRDVNQIWADPPRLAVFISGAILFTLGWSIRHLTSS
jgi:hypothetical protein